MATYNSNRGYAIKLLGFDEQFEDCLIYRDTKESIIALADCILRATTKFSLMNALNEMQIESGERSFNSVFASKYTIPLYFINLVCRPRGIEILGKD